jgi:HlyD family secretion protein
MKRARRIAWLGILAAAAALGLAGCNHASEGVYQGWVEADLVFVGPDEMGRVQTLVVREGDAATAGMLLYTLDEDLQLADVQQNQATLANARQAFERAQQLLKSGSGTQKAFDDAQSALREAEARLNSSQTRLTRRKVFSPATGVIQQIYYRPGEMVAAMRPVLSLLPPGNMKIRFFVPEAELPKFFYGETIRISCDGCAGDIKARISFLAKSAEFTPPVIYSLEERAKLVFLIEARTDTPEKLRVGQPVSVSMLPQEASR